jgi:hypothetical protein
MSQRIPPDLLRDMVREILRDVVESEVAAPEGDVVSGRPDDGSGGGRWRETVSIASQDDLNRAVRRLLADATDPHRRGAIERGDVAFVLSDVSPAPAGSSARETVQRVDKGAVTEKHVRAAAESGAVIVMAARVVVTPLAKDKARSLGVVIRRET